MSRVVVAAILCCAFPAIASAQEGEQLFLEMYKVLAHPRCVNCHPVGDSPKQGLSRVHTPPVARGPKGEGVAGLQCSACHQASNNAASGVPGAPRWHLAPRSMAWESLSAPQLCRALLDRKKNGNQDRAAVVKHLTEDELVAWGWNPGKDASGNEREPVPISRERFSEIVHAWSKAGAPCPK
jgi:mono/diheme cytochrome c family protein